MRPTCRRGQWPTTRYPVSRLAGGVGLTDPEIAAIRLEVPQSSVDPEIGNRVVEPRDSTLCGKAAFGTTNMSSKPAEKRILTMMVLRYRRFLRNQNLGNPIAVRQNQIKRAPREMPRAKKASTDFVVVVGDFGRPASTDRSRQNSPDSALITKSKRMAPARQFTKPFWAGPPDAVFAGNDSMGRLTKSSQSKKSP